jgi:hypothetical protein
LRRRGVVRSPALLRPAYHGLPARGRREHKKKIRRVFRIFVLLLAGFP